MSDVNQTLLNELRDIHYPPMISWWPPAIGWWIVALLLCIGMIAGIVIGKKFWLKNRQKQALLDALNTLRQQYNDQQTNVVEQLSILIRRAAMLRFPRQHIAALQGKEWLHFLNQMTPKPLFTQALMTAPYQAMPSQQTMALLDATEQWIKEWPTL